MARGILGLDDLGFGTDSAKFDLRPAYRFSDLGDKTMNKNATQRRDGSKSEAKRGGNESGTKTKRHSKHGQPSKHLINRDAPKERDRRTDPAHPSKSPSWVRLKDAKSKAIQTTKESSSRYPVRYSTSSRRRIFNNINVGRIFTAFGYTVAIFVIAMFGLDLLFSVPFERSSLPFDITAIISGLALFHLSRDASKGL